MSGKNDVSIAVLSLFGIPAIIILDVVLSGWALSILWQWFISPIFEIRNISIAEAIGITIVITYLTHQSPTNKDERDNPFVMSIIVSIIKPLFAVFIGWIIKMFI